MSTCIRHISICHTDQCDTDTRDLDSLTPVAFFQCHRPVRLRYSSHRTAAEDADCRQHPEHHVHRPSVRRPHSRPLQGHLSCSAGKRTLPRGVPLFEAELPLPLSGDHHQMDSETEGEAGLTRRFSWRRRKLTRCKTLEKLP